MPADASQTRSRILAAAETLFAKLGFEAVSLRAVARDANVQIGLVHYHFKSKEGLYRAVWAHCYASLADLRRERLPALEEHQDRPEALRQLVDLFVTPLLAGPELRPFLRIMAHEYADPNGPSRGVIQDLVDPVTQVMMAAFRRVLPTLSEADLGWGYQAMTGALMMHVVDAGNAMRLTGGAARSGDTAAALPALCQFIVGGWLALADAPRQKSR